MTPLEKIAYAIKEKEKYQKVWEKAKDESIDIIDNNEKLSDEQKESAIEKTETAYKNATQFTFSQKVVSDLVRNELEESGIDIGEVIRDHYEPKDVVKAVLITSLVNKSGLNEKEARILADAVDKSFATLMNDRIVKILDKYINKSTRKTTSKQKKGAEEIIQMVSIGAFDNEKFRDAFADAWGLAKLDDADIKYIISQSDKIQKINSEVLRYDYKKQLLAHIGYFSCVRGLQSPELYGAPLHRCFASRLSCSAHADSLRLRHAPVLHARRETSCAAAVLLLFLLCSWVTLLL